MKCPNPDCNATDHESGAKFCHRCGTPLVNGDRNPYSDREKTMPRTQLTLDGNITHKLVVHTIM